MKKARETGYNNFYVHVHQYKLPDKNIVPEDKTTMKKLTSARYVTKARDVRELFYRLEVAYGDFYGTLKNNLGKYIGYIYVRREYYTEIEVYAYPVQVRHTFIHPLFPGEDTSVPRETDIIKEYEYEPIEYPLPAMKQLQHK